MENNNSLIELDANETITFENINNTLSQKHQHIIMGSGACTLCSCTGYDDDGSGFNRCKCGDRKMDHQ